MGVPFADFLVNPKRQHIISSIFCKWYNWQLGVGLSKILEPTFAPVTFTVIFRRPIRLNNGLKTYGQNLAHIWVDNHSNKHLMMIICVLFFRSLLMNLFTTGLTMYFIRRKEACCGPVLK